MLKFEYEIKSSLSESSQVEHLYWISQIEGDFRVLIDGRPCLVCRDELLLAITIVMKRWLRLLEDEPFLEFSYYSMNYDIESVLKFSPTNNDIWIIESEWENKLRPVSRDSLLTAVVNFVKKIEADLSNSPIDLSAEYQEHVEDFLRDNKGLRVRSVS